MFYLTVVNKTRRHCHSWLAGQYIFIIYTVIQTKKKQDIFVWYTFHVRIQRGGQGVRTPLKNHKI